MWMLNVELILSSYFFIVFRICQLGVYYLPGLLAVWNCYVCCFYTLLQASWSWHLGSHFFPSEVCVQRCFMFSHLMLFWESLRPVWHFPLVLYYFFDWDAYSWSAGYFTVMIVHQQILLEHILCNIVWLAKFTNFSF